MPQNLFLNAASCQTAYRTEPVRTSIGFGIKRSKQENIRKLAAFKDNFSKEGFGAFFVENLKIFFENKMPRNNE